MNEDFGEFWPDFERARDLICPIRGFRSGDRGIASPSMNCGLFESPPFFFRSSKFCTVSILLSVTATLRFEFSNVNIVCCLVFT